MRLYCGILLAVAAMVLLSLRVPLASAASTTGSVTMVSQSGDYIVGGTDLLFDVPGTVSLGGGLGAVTVQTPTPVGAAFGYTLSFGAASGSQLGVGEFSNALRYPFNGASPGLDVSGNGRGCNMDYGRFTVRDIHVDSSGNVDRFWALYEQHCEGPYAPALFGEVRINEPASSAPETVEPAAVSWPATPIGTTGTYVPLMVTAGAQGAQVSSVLIAGSNAGDFVVGTDGCSGVTLTAGATCQVSVALAPTAAGDLHATLVLTDADGAVTTVPLDYLAQPDVASVSPVAGLPAGGTRVTIHGSEFTGVTGVRFGTQSAAYTVDSPTQITATAPPGTLGTFSDIIVTNAHGDSAVYPGDRFAYANPPPPPTNVSAVAGDRQEVINFVPPTETGGTPITSYTVTASPGGAHATGTSSPITVAGLDDATSYTFSVTATNAVGTSPRAISSAVTTLKPTSTTLTASPASSYYGTPIQLSATVMSPFAGAPTGTLVFGSGPTWLGSATLDGTGQATLGPAIVVGVGSTVTASYGGDSAFKASVGTLQPDIHPAVTGLTLASSANPAAPGSSAVITATVVNSSSPARPYGSVAFFVDGNPILTPQYLDPMTDQAKIALQLPTGTYSVTARFVSRDQNFLGSTASLTQSFEIPTYTGPVPPTPAPPTTPTPPSPMPASAFSLGRPITANDGTIDISAHTASAGRFTFAASVVRGSGPRIYGTGSATTTGRAPVTLVLRPTHRARMALARDKQMRLVLAVAFTPSVPGRPTVTLVAVTARFHSPTRTQRRH